MKQWIAILAVLGLSFSALAFEVDQKASVFKWTGKKVTGQHYGKLPIQSSKVDVKNGQVVGGEFVLDITKMTVDDLKGEMQKKFLGHMKSKDFFEVSRWPTAKLVVEKLDGKKAIGKLTIKGKTKKVEFSYLKKGNLFSGTLKFDRTQFDMIYGSGNFFKNLGDKMIYNDVTVDFKVQLSKKKKLAQK